MPRAGIEPERPLPVPGFQVVLCKFLNCCKYYIYQLVITDATLGFVGFYGVVLGPRGQSHGQSRRGSISYILLDQWSGFWIPAGKSIGDVFWATKKTFLSGLKPQVVTDFIAHIGHNN